MVDEESYLVDEFFFFVEHRLFHNIYICRNLFSVTNSYIDVYVKTSPLTHLFFSVRSLRNTYVVRQIST